MLYNVSHLLKAMLSELWRFYSMSLTVRRSKFWAGWDTWRTCRQRGITATLASQRSTREPARSRDWWSRARYWRNTNRERCHTDAMTSPNNLTQTHDLRYKDEEDGVMAWSGLYLFGNTPLFWQHYATWPRTRDSANRTASEESVLNVATWSVSYQFIL